jgi:hypothetical protein
MVIKWAFNLQMGLFHGSKPLCPTLSHTLKGPADESGIFEVDKVSERINLFKKGVKL